MSIIGRTSSVRRALMAGMFVAVGALATGVATAPAHAQYYSYQYNNNPYWNSNPYDYGYRHAYWRWRHEYWRWYHQNYGR